MADSYQGPVKVLGGSDGILLTTGSASLEHDVELGTWQGKLQTLRGTAVAGKALVVYLQIPDAGNGKAQLTPIGESGEMSVSAVVGLGPQPF